MFSNGMIKEELFDDKNVPTDTNYNGTIASRNMNISNENRQRAKVLSSNVQMQERNDMLYQKRYDIYQKQKDFFDKEQQDYKLNAICEQKLLQMVRDHDHLANQSRLIRTIPDTIQFSDLSNNINCEILNRYGKSLKQVEVKAFVRVRSEVTQKGYRISYLNVPTLKSDLIEKVIELKNAKPRQPFHSEEPSEHVRSVVECSNLGDNDDVSIEDESSATGVDVA